MFRDLKYFMMLPFATAPEGETDNVTALCSGGRHFLSSKDICSGNILENMVQNRADSA